MKKNPKKRIEIYDEIENSHRASVKKNNDPLE